jgi:GDP-mannose pyrophosphatase NudK
MSVSIKIVDQQVIYKNRYSLTEYTLNYKGDNQQEETKTKLVFNRGNGANILLYNPDSRNIILTRQFRLPTFVNGNPSGFLLEVCAGTLEVESPENCIRRETEEETGYRIDVVKKVFEAYMTPGAVTELLYFFVAPYKPVMKINPGGGLAEEQENIEVVEMPFMEAVAMMNRGEIRDAKTLILIQYALIHNLLEIET